MGQRNTLNRKFWFRMFGLLKCFQYDRNDWGGIVNKLWKLHNCIKLYRYPIWENGKRSCLLFGVFDRFNWNWWLDCLIRKFVERFFLFRTFGATKATFRNCPRIYEEKGDWYRDICPRHPPYLRPFRSRRRRFVWISLTVSRTRHARVESEKSTGQQLVRRDPARYS